MDQGVKLNLHRGDTNSEDWKRSYKEILFIAGFIRLVQ
jgi:hypothetical protein